QQYRCDSLSRSQTTLQEAPLQRVLLDGEVVAVVVSARPMGARPSGNGRKQGRRRSRVHSLCSVSTPIRRPQQSSSPPSPHTRG
ncbi:hypothetical protein PMAYCL1PPCAC_28148, partial [Pristionchus mayeri]